MYMYLYFNERVIPLGYADALLNIFGNWEIDIRADTFISVSEVATRNLFWQNDSTFR